MLRAIRKFAFRRGRGADQGSEGLVEKDNAVDQGDTFDDLLQSTRQEIEEPSGPPVRGRVKWFSSIKGYGFVVLSDGSGDVFLHASALAGIGITTLQPGETLEFRVAPGQRGPQAAEVISVDSSTAASPRPSRRSFGIAIRPTALAGKCPGGGNGEVVQRHQGVRFYCLGGWREGGLRARFCA